MKSKMFEGNDKGFIFYMLNLQYYEILARVAMKYTGI